MDIYHITVNHPSSKFILFSFLSSDTPPGLKEFTKVSAEFAFGKDSQLLKEQKVALRLMILKDDRFFHNRLQRFSPSLEQELSGSVQSLSVQISIDLR